MIKLNKIYKTIQDNLAIIILLPTIFGGLWQLIELSSLSFSFVRFFSVTQLLPDGLLILTMIILLYIAYYFGVNKHKFKYNRKILNLKTKKPNNFNFIKNLQSSQKLKYVDNPIYRKENIFFELLIIILSPILFYLFFKLTNIYDELINDFNFIFFVITFYFIILFLNIFLSSLFILFVHFFESKSFSKVKEYCIDKPVIKEFLLFPVKMLILILIILVILFPMKIGSFFHEKYLLPKNLKNLEYLDKTLNNKNYQSNKIVYLNDKYIFIEHKMDGITSIEIVKFDELFQKDTYKVIIEKE
ncbi:hypothetical protein ACN4FE_08215 [Aliarcobacter butzleri]|uniref:hypothetical protein n=1 Tax=Aliarcobacter butzleri TaxID=28197 RepID=UPI001ED9DF44|nr:hypothetical protein [Aliarcobacter butzleri]MCG3688152.1 hypothetical protein [Aliarcobacter butzleri]